jgi:K+-sensing histidine kinase KdpD
MKTRELVEKDSFSNMLISVLAHDLRQPFATLIMFVDMIKHTNQNLSQEEMLMVIENMRDTASKSIKFLDGLLYWIKTESDGFSYQFEALPLQDLINEANTLYHYEQQFKGVSFYNLIPNGQLIYAHKQMLQFINRNILSNATKHSAEGGNISVTCSLDQGWVTVAISDQGGGMTTDKLERLFNIHDSGTDSDYHINSAGIALSICKDMIYKMNGKLWAESMPDNGTTFFYSLPVI